MMTIVVLLVLGCVFLFALAGGLAIGSSIPHIKNEIERARQDQLDKLDKTTPT